MSAYYNEFDPKAAATLRELIREGLIAPGDVDERSIEDVLPSEIAGYTQVHLFAGFGIWSLAFRMVGWPDSRPVWSASCPCQPFSAAGKGGGFADDRHLWPAAFWLLQHGKRPEVPVYGEQVASPDGLSWIDLVRADLETIKHSLWSTVLASAGFGAPIIRQRSYWMACASEQSGGWNSGGFHSTQGEIDCEGFEDGSLANGFGVGGDARRLACTTGQRLEQRMGFESFTGGEVARVESERLCDARGLAGPEHDGSQGSTTEPNGDGKNGRLLDGSGYACRMGGTERTRRQPIKNDPRSDGEGISEDWKRFQSSEPVLYSDGSRRPGPTNGFWRDADWLRCRDDKWRPVEPGTFPLAHGYPERVGILRGAGNAISPQVAASFIWSTM